MTMDDLIKELDAIMEGADFVAHLPPSTNDTRIARVNGLVYRLAKALRTAALATGQKT